jgi:uncharacterized OB-fold protein
MRKCDNCGHDIEDQWRFCGQCGHSSPSPAANSRDQWASSNATRETASPSFAKEQPSALGAERCDAADVAAHAQSPASPQEARVLARDVPTPVQTQAWSQPPEHPAAPQTQAPMGRDLAGEPAVPKVSGRNKKPGIGRGAIPVAVWGASLAILGWLVWIISLWPVAQPPHGSLNCTVGQSAPIPNYGPCTPALQKTFADLTSGVNQLAASVWPNYHMDLAWIGLVIGFAVLIVLYLYNQAPLLAVSPAGPSGRLGSPNASVASRKIWTAVILLGFSVALAGTGALLVHAVQQLSAEISTAERACSAVGLSCVSGSSYAALVAGWVAIGGGALALLGGLLCIGSITLGRRRIVASAGIQEAAPQPRMELCNHCGTALHPDDQFCAGCGVRRTGAN